MSRAYADKRDQALRLEAKREAELVRQRQAAEEELRSMPFTQSSDIDLGVGTVKNVPPTGPVTARQPSPTPVPNRPLMPEGEMRAPEGIRPQNPSGLMDAFLSLFGSQSTGGGQLNLDPRSIWEHGSIIAPGQYEQAVQARNDAGIEYADQQIARMRANNAAHRQKLDQMAAPARVMATRKTQGQR